MRCRQPYQAETIHVLPRARDGWVGVVQECELVTRRVQAVNDAAEPANNHAPGREDDVVDSAYQPENDSYQRFQCCCNLAAIISRAGQKNRSFAALRVKESTSTRFVLLV